MHPAAEKGNCKGRGMHLRVLYDVIVRVQVATNQYVAMCRGSTARIFCMRSSTVRLLCRGQSADTRGRIIVTDRSVSATPCLCVHLCAVACARFRVGVFFVLLTHRHVYHLPKRSGGVFAAPGTLSCKDRKGICCSERGRRAGTDLFFRTLSSVRRMLSVFCFALTV
ncbi:unnamed protein product, partial [Ectocarpus sp. 4 AP-2014]